MTWNEKYGYYTKIGVEEAYKEKTGNVAEINLMLVAMLRMAGIEASPVLISTRENGIALFPNRSRFNYVIASASIDDKNVLLDATHKLSNINVLPIRDLNWLGRLINKDGTSTEIDLMPKTASKSNTNLMATITASGEITGMIKMQNFDYNAFNFREKEAGLTTESYLEKLEKQLNGSQIEGYTVENKSELDKPVIETFSFKNSNSVDIIGDKIYFNPLLFFAQTGNPFKQEKRGYSVDFVYSNQERYQTIITIPEGYVVESIPKPITVVFTDKLLSYKFNVSANDKQVQVVSVFDINTTLVSPGNYEELKAFYNEMIKKQTEKVVLKKI
jgi:hypothetical protein